MIAKRGTTAMPISGSGTIEAIIVPKATAAWAESMIVPNKLV